MGAAATVQKMKAADGTTDRSGEGRRFVVKKLYHEATKPQLLGVARVVASEAVRMDWKPDLVHLHVAYPAGAAAVAWAKKWGVPVVLTEHWTAYHTPSNWPWWRRRAIKDVVKAVNAVCPVTADLGQAMVDGSGRSRFTWCPTWWTSSGLPLPRLKRWRAWWSANRVDNWRVPRRTGFCTSAPWTTAKKTSEDCSTRWRRRANPFQTCV